ncbi:Carbohydrate-selective porin OprB [Chthoniobacter flavus Ellin428]|uniref:Carbohydrate-selective porin OprB n=1 Tax=Chthoniobacter flavus Ellin428 TaxID=497964 RepID=B4D8L3_9BACT|nr:carbohydrate porin [Chthoniobacter flavus]EDY17235.1 Carbohydrate-selective porin OprB [Chthoniobacter flavus Ellin428]TCO86940.1 OprB family porin [Chthoniobacter flavus]
MKTRLSTIPQYGVSRLDGIASKAKGISRSVVATLLLAAVTPAFGGQEVEPQPGAAAHDPLQPLKDAGFTPSLNYWGEEFANFAGGTGRGAEYEGLLKLGLNIDLEKVVKWHGSSLYFAVEYPHGLGLTNKYVHDYNVLSNIDAYDSWRLFEAWVQQDFCNHHVSLRVGQLTTDNNFFISDNAALYVNSVFGELGTVSHNIFDPAYPVASPGVWLKVSPTASWYFQAMMVSDDPGAQDGDNKHGLRYNFGGGARPLSFFEFGYIRAGTEDAPILEGKYKIGAYYDAGLFRDNQGGSPHHGTSAWWGVVDQQLYRESYQPKEPFCGLSAFGRISTAQKDRNPVTFYFDAGLNYTGPIAHRQKDILGVAFIYERLSSLLQQPDGSPVPSHHEHVLEATYLCTLNDHFAVQPDIQYIINPGAMHTIPNALAGGLRFIISF